MKNRPWTGAETKLLRSYVEQNMTANGAAERLGRSYPAVVAQIKRMGLQRIVMTAPVDFTVRVSSATYDRLNAAAKRQGLTKGQFYRNLIERELDRLEEE